MRDAHRYQPYYCEENAWHLARSLCAQNIPETAQTPHAMSESTAGVPAAEEGYVLIISNPTKSCALWHQQAAPSPTDAIVWDYHVIVLWPSSPGAFADRDATQRDEAWAVWDLDTLLGMPCPARWYLRSTFSGWRAWPGPFQPLFRVIPASEYIATLSTDRSHMQREDGTYLKPPPPWTPPFDPQKGPNLMQLIDLQDTEQPGQIMALPQLEALVRPYPR